MVLETLAGHQQRESAVSAGQVEQAVRAQLEPFQHDREQLNHELTDRAAVSLFPPERDWFHPSYSTTRTLSCSKLFIGSMGLVTGRPHRPRRQGKAFQPSGPG
jgi:hypothetical protein